MLDDLADVPTGGVLGRAELNLSGIQSANGVDELFFKLVQG